MSWWQPWKKQHKQGFVLALGGGGSRGMAHLGVLEVLDAEGLRPDAIVGTSIGALFGAMYALHTDVQVVEEKISHFMASDAFRNLALPNMEHLSEDDISWLSRMEIAARQTVMMTRAVMDIALSDSEDLLKNVNMLLSDASFDDLSLPLYVTAVSFPLGECHVFSKGDLCRSVAASMAIPGVFKPIELAGQRYVDGGVASELPAKEARMVCGSEQCVVAVNVGSRPSKSDEPKNVMGMLDWSAGIKGLYLRQYKKDFADVLVEPLVGFTSWDDFSHVEQEIECGRRAMLEQLPHLKTLLYG
ncbi:MAG: patatin-like phospholipase family protein [Mariprofundaceae bacterium]|nr:patatin-like phospholipase family protein [Mariprofundaceae bacterium]